MYVRADLNKCMGYGNCVATAPEIFRMRDDGKVEVIKPAVETEGDIAMVLAAVRSCPTSALSTSNDK